MDTKQKIFKTMWRRYGEDILVYVYQNQPVSFRDICGKFDRISKNQVRHILNDMSSSGLIKSIQTKNEGNPRGRGYIIDNETLVINLLELHIDTQ